MLYSIDTYKILHTIQKSIYFWLEISFSHFTALINPSESRKKKFHQLLSLRISSSSAASRAISDIASIRRNDTSPLHGGAIIIRDARIVARFACAQTTRRRDARAGP